MATVETYRHPPLVLALVEVRHPPLPEPLSRGDLAGLKAALIKTLPLQSADEVGEMQVHFAGQGPMPPTSQMRTRSRPRFSSRDKLTYATFNPDSFTLETRNYRGWADMKALLTTVASALFSVIHVDGVERVGLRYIDEIRVPGEGVPDWQKWVSPSLAAPTPLDNLRPVQQQSVVQYQTDSQGETVTLRYGAVNGPSVIGDWVTPAPPPGQFFLLDTDAAWTSPAGQPVPEANFRNVAELAETLHGPVKDLFESLLTAKLRDEVLNAD